MKLSQVSDKIKKLWSQFVSALAKNEINARLKAISTIFPEFRTMLNERMAIDAAAAKADAKERVALLAEIAAIDEKLKGHKDFEEAAKLLLAK